MNAYDKYNNSPTEKDVIVKLYTYEVLEFPWGAGVRERRSQKWIRVFIFPNAQEINVEDLDVELHENGIEFK